VKTETSQPTSESPVPDSAIFTNCGNAAAEAPKLQRVPFTVSRLAEFCSRKELVNQTGHDVHEWPCVILKEGIDNALDAAEEAGIPPVVTISVSGQTVTIEDNGPGIPATTIEKVLNYTVRVSSREAYCSPTRGAQGNALKTILPMGYVLNEHLGDRASSTTIIETHGVAHRIRFSVDHIRQEPRIEHRTKLSSVRSGTRITVTLPHYHGSNGYSWDLFSNCKEEFLQLAEAFASFNPHLTLRVFWKGELKVDAKATGPGWRKWLPSWPTCAHWYDQSRLRRYMAAHISHNGAVMRLHKRVSRHDRDREAKGGARRDRRLACEVG
jgi:hypothetical protein